jgi:hypothetical protein
MIEAIIESAQDYLVAYNVNPNNDAYTKLLEKDVSGMMQIVALLIVGKHKDAYKFACELDTAVKEYLPGAFWNQYRFA